MRRHDVDPAALRVVFERLLSVDSDHHDRRRRDYNQALFLPEGPQAWTQINLTEVLHAYDRAVAELGRRQ